MDKEYAKHLKKIFNDKILNKRMKLRLDYLSRVYRRDDKRLFAELCFCLLTPQTKARNGCKAVIALYKENLLFSGSEEAIAKTLQKHVRFHNTKAKNIVTARNLYFPNGIFLLREKIDVSVKNNKVTELRNTLAKEVKGFGLKEASHFLRNIGFGQTISILDRHILRVMDKLSILPDSFTVKSSLTKNNYEECEKKLIEYSQKEKIPMEYLDFVFWYDATDDIFK